MHSSSRPETLEALRTGTFDLLVIGAGIVGSRIAYEAAGAGLRVALVDAGDFGGGTSSASSKLVHGGLRYLSTGQPGLVRASLAERRMLERRRPSPGDAASARRRGAGDRRRTRVSAGSHLYAALRVPHPEAAFSTRGATGARPSFGKRSAYVHAPPQATTHAAGSRSQPRGRPAPGDGLNYRLSRSSRSRTGGRAVLPVRSGEGLVTLRCRARHARPMRRSVRQLEDPVARPTVRLSKGVHVVLPAAEGWRAALALWDEGRSLVVVPWQGVLLLGATDTPFEGDPGDVRPEDADVAELLAAGRHLLPAEALAPGRVLSAFAGLRVLPPGDGRTSRAPRSHVVTVGPAQS